jgi:hypothetical protein
VKRSNNSAARVLFYLELARIGGCPVFLSPEKRRFFRFVGEEVVPEVYALLERTVEGRMRGTVSELVQQVYGFRREFPVPPLPEYLLSVAERKSVSLLDAFWEIRNGQNAGTFRTWLDGAQRLARENTRPSALALEKHLNEADRLARRWARELDVGLGVKHEVHRANLEAAPGIGWLAKLLGVGRVDYRSRLLRPKLEHMAFVADWYSDPDRG